MAPIPAPARPPIPAPFWASLSQPTVNIRPRLTAAAINKIVKLLVIVSLHYFLYKV
jgi:hypothetical protein